MVWFVKRSYKISRADEREIERKRERARDLLKTLGALELWRVNGLNQVLWFKKVQSGFEAM